MTKGKLNMGGFSTGQGSSWCSGLLLQATVPLFCSGQQTQCITSSQVPQEAEEVLEKGRAKSIKTELRSQQSLAVSPSPLAPGSEIPRRRAGCAAPRQGAGGPSTGQSGLGQINAKG